VVVWDATGRIQSNPAYLFVVGGPQILIQPDDRVAFAGAASSMSVGAVGTAPTTYQWYHNGALLPGATQPTLAFQNIQSGDGGSYHVTVGNDFGSASSRDATLTVYGRPLFAPLSDLVSEVLTPIALTVGATDPNSPKLPLKFSLASGPTNATINATNGLFQWTPTRSQAPGQYPITVVLRDEARPDLTVSATFGVSIIDYIEATTANFVMTAGESNMIPVEIFSTTPLQNLSLRLSLKREHLKNLSVEEMMAPQAVITSTNAATPDLLQFSFDAGTGAYLQGTQQLARLHFNTTADQTSALVPLTIESLTYTRAVSGLEPTLLINQGRVVILGSRPLLEARMENGQRQLVLYGKTGSNYTVQSRLNLLPGNAWANRSTVTMTNMARVIASPSPTAPLIFFQLRQ